MTEILASGGGEGDFNVLGVPLGEFIIGGLAFLIVFGVLAKLLLPKIKQALEEREEAIKGGLEKAEQAQAEAAALLAANDDALAKAREEAAEIRTQAQAERAQIIEDARQEAREAAAKETAAAQAQIAADKAKAQSELQKSVGTMATDLAGRIVGDQMLDRDRASAVVDGFINELESAAPQGSGS